jgi:hypothetical protein
MTKQKFTQSISVFIALSISLGFLASPPASAQALETCEEGSCSVTFSYTGQTEVWYPPKNAIDISFQVLGAQGGNSGGFGGEVTGVLTTKPTILHVTVGGAGRSGAGVPGGFNGGGPSGDSYSREGSGGGASDIRLGSELGSRIVVAGGGGGAGLGLNSGGGAGGGLTGGSGSANGQIGGSGGSQISGGSGATASSEFATGDNGEEGFGGQGGSSSAESLGAGGGGGGGYFGGGGGSAAEDELCCTYSSGGGGGSSYADPSRTENVQHRKGVTFGFGLVVFNYRLTPVVNEINPTLTFTRSDSVAFRVEFTESVENVELKDFEILPSQDSCKSAKLSGSQAIYTLMLEGCEQGELSVRLSAGSVTAYGVPGPTGDSYSSIARVDWTAPSVKSLDYLGGSLWIIFDENIWNLPFSSLSLSSEDTACQIAGVSQLVPSEWEVELANCDNASFELSILSESIEDLAGNLGPLNESIFSRTYESSQTPSTEPPTSSEPVTSGTNVVGPTTLDQEPAGVTLDKADLDTLAPEASRRQAAQRLILPGDSPTAQVDSSAWTVGLASFGILLLGAGLYVSRRDLPLIMRG